METKLATDLFNEWAINGKDIGMEKGHATAVGRMIEIAKEQILDINPSSSILDIGCGNGWMLRKILSLYPKSSGLGIDGAHSMIQNAKKTDPSGNYQCANLNTWVSEDQYDLIITMEVLYYLDNPLDFIKTLFNNTLKDGGNIVVGMDHYKENPVSLSWASDLNVHMNTFSIEDWNSVFVDAGFSDIEFEQYNKKENWEGTLIIRGTKK